MVCQNLVLLKTSVKQKTTDCRFQSMVFEMEDGKLLRFFLSYLLYRYIIFCNTWYGNSVQSFAVWHNG